MGISVSVSGCGLVLVENRVRKGKQDINMHFLKLSEMLTK